MARGELDGDTLTNGEEKQQSMLRARHEKRA
jgi:hypothetical protein